MNVDLSFVSIIATLILGVYMAYTAAKKTNGPPLREQVASLTEQVEALRQKNDALQDTLVLVRSELSTARDEAATNKKLVAEQQKMIEQLKTDLDRCNLLISTLAPRVQMQKDSNIYQTLNTQFSEAELRELAFGLKLDLEQLGGANKAEKVLELIGHFERRDDLGSLVGAIRKARPNAKLG